MLRLSIRDPSGERVFATERTEIVVGSREGADLHLADPAAAPNHCLLRVEGGRVRLIDLGTRGTRANGRNVDQAVLDAGGEFAVGATVVRVVSCEGPAPRLELEEPPPPPPPPPHRSRPPHESDFAREVRETLARAPWYLISLVVHVVLLLLLDLVAYRTELPRQRVHMVATLPREMPGPDVPPDAPPEPEQFEPPDILGKLELEEPSSADVRKDPLDAELLEIDDPGPPERIGLRSGRSAVRIRLPVPKVKGGDAALDKGDLDGEHGRATDEVKRDLGNGLRNAKEGLSDDYIVVVSGAHDKIELVLKGYGWPFTLVSREDLLRRPYPSARILFINCSNKPSPAQAGKLAEIVKRRLQAGCWVVTSDWSVEPYLTAAFPTHVHLGGSGRSQRNTTVIVEPSSDDRLLQGVFDRGRSSEWWLEDSSTMVEVAGKTDVLVTSEDMKSRYGARVVAFKFEYGKGLVLHLVGHFYQKDGNRRGLVAMHRLINNVILERLRADHAGK
jgi:hypothetical protein